MKKKAIEKIPYMTLPACDPDETVLYIGRTAWRNIDHERHIILEVYENKEDRLQVPVVRYVATKKDWGIYDTETETWSRRKMDSYIYGSGFCWEDERIHRPYNMCGSRKHENRLYSAEDLSRIKKFFGKIRAYSEEEWWDYFEKNEAMIKNEKRSRAYRRRRERLEDRQRNTPPLDEQALLDWADACVFHKRHYLYYKKRHSRADLCCSACGGTYSGKWKPGMSYESQLERLIEEPREGLLGKCTLCGAHGIYKPQGKVKGSHRMKGYVFLADRYLDQGVVLRYIELGKEWQLEQICGEKEPEMYGAHEKLDGVEIARTYFLPGKDVRTDFHKHDPWKGEDFWDDCNLYGNANICINKAPVHPDTFENLEGTFLQYSALKEYACAWKEVNAKEYLERYLRYPQLEMLVKLKLYKTAKHIARAHLGIIENHGAARLDQFLGIRKDKTKLLVEEQGDIEILEILKKEKRLDANWTWQQVKNLAEIRAGNRDLGTALGIMSLQKLLNNIAKYAGYEYGTGCSTAVARLESTAGTYLDYLRMRRDLGYDMSNMMYQRPRDLDVAHAGMVLESGGEEMDERMEMVKKEFPDIQKNYRKLRKRYFYEDEEYVIRPARSAEEIIEEGRLLHHCVGRDNYYLSKHNRGNTYILMLRFKDKPEIPYITVEINSRTDSIIQWYGKYDGKPNEKNMEKWLKQYVTKLKAGALGGKEEDAQEPVQGLLMAAV